MHKYFLLLILFITATLSAADKPNVIMIMIDDMGYECLGTYGGTTYKTPQMDKLANDGLKFNYCHSTPICTTSRVQLMTGKYNFRNYEEFGYLKNGETTFGNLMQQAGYKTMIAGKWQLNGLYSKEERHLDPKKVNEFGFDEYCLWQLSKQKKEGGERFWKPLVEQNGKSIKKSQDGQYGPDIFTNYICDFMEREKDKPFFVYYPMALVHDPFISTPDSDNMDVKGQAGFTDMMAYCDKMIGRIRSKVESLGLAENTLIMVTGDNGTHKKIKSTMNGRIVQGGKASTKEAGTHVPLIAYWQGTTPVGKAIDDLVDFTDLLPTIIEVGQGSLPQDQKFDGRSILPQIKGQTGNKRDWVFCHYQPRWGSFDKISSRWAQTQRYKLYQDGRFFDLEKDVLETTPLKVSSEKLQTIQAKLQAAIDQYEQEVPYDKSRDKKSKKK
jgi:arylsulfatase A